MSALDAIAVVAALAAAGCAGLRWLRVAQREHYLPGSAARFALRWWGGFGPNRVLAGAAVLGTVLSPLSPLCALAGALAIGAGPFRFPWRGRAPGPLRWTRRLRTLAGVSAAITLAPVAVSLAVGGAVPVAEMMALLSPLVVDAACAITTPVEDRLAERFVAAARQRLATVRPRIVAITGSYGKTSTKAYVAHLCAGSRRVVASPASFNNRAGLSRAINEHLANGTEVFVAEMGTYGPGEIAELCRWCPPEISAITAIGPVHLERFGTEDAIVRAKREIFGPARVAVLNVDDPRLARVATEEAARGLEVRRCAVDDASADVRARLVDGRLEVRVAGDHLATVDDPGAAPGNVAIAVSIALALGVDASEIARRLPDLPSVANRQAITTLSTGASAVDDTFNSNPAGARAALARLTGLASREGKRVVVTPGMIELGPRQATENEAFGAAMAAAATHVLVVGWTNRAALLAGLRSAPSGPWTGVFDRREDAVAWVRANTAPGDVVLYENDLPDHYP